MENFIKILDIVAWPLVVSLSMLFFRKDLRNVLKRLVRVETSSAKMMFSEELKKIDADLSSDTRTDTAESLMWIDEMKEIARINPRAAIIEAWTAIEIECIKKGMIQGTAIKRFSPNDLKSFLMNLDDFDIEMVNRIMSLRRLRKRVEYGMDADFEYLDAKKYIELADKVLFALSNS